MTESVIAVLGVLASSLIAGIVAFLVGKMKFNVEFQALQENLKTELRKVERETRDLRNARKVDIAYKFAELSQKDRVAAETFMNEVAKETAIGFLYFEDGRLKPKIWVRNDANLLVGRSDRCDVQIADNTVSRQHCVIHAEGNKVYVMPLRPTNPILMNGEPVGSKREVAHGSRLTFGGVELEYFSL